MLKLDAEQICKEVLAQWTVQTLQIKVIDNYHSPDKLWVVIKCLSSYSELKMCLLVF